MKEKNDKNMNRREFLRRLGAGTAVSAAALAGCGPDKSASSHLAQGEIPTDKMTYRTNPKTGEKVSLLG